jgi:beta-lactamase regulating signal transducer with metallopeptidase domain
MNTPSAGFEELAGGNEQRQALVTGPPESTIDARDPNAVAERRQTVRIPASLWPGVYWTAFAIWGLGAMIILILQLVRWAGAGFIAEMATSIDDETRTTLADRIRRSKGISRPVVLLKSDLAAVSMAWGLLRPAVIFPTDSAAWSSDKFKAVLMHELEHVRRRDNLTHLLVVFICALYWFNPLVWVALRRLHYEREVACDDSVLNAGTPASAYARYLMEITMRLKGPKCENILPAVMAQSSGMKRRLISVLSETTNRQPLGRFAALSWLFVILGVALPIATFRPWSDASAQGDSAVGERLTETTETATRISGGGETALHFAATYGHLRVAMALMEMGADPNATDVAGRTPLHEAACYGHRDIARILLQAGADEGARDDDQETPLHEAATYGHEEVARLLMDHGAPPDAVDVTGETPLHAAATYGHADVAELLLDAGVDPSVEDNYGRTPLENAATYGHLDVVRLLLRFAAE